MSRREIFIEILIFCLSGVTSFIHRDSSLGIVGGHSINITEAPFMARFYTRLSNSCGATIVHESFVISSARCYIVKKAMNKTMFVTVGTDKTSGGGATHVVIDGFLHPSFYSLFDSISLLKLAKPLKFSEKIKPIPLAKTGFVVPEGAMVDAMGFGSTSADIYDLTIPDQLQKITVPAISYKKCNKVYRYVKKTMICADVLGKGACFLDYGGPLMYEDMLVGVLTKEIGCGEENIPSVYVYIPTYRDFIDSTIQANA